MSGWCNVQFNNNRESSHNEHNGMNKVTHNFIQMIACRVFLRFLLLLLFVIILYEWIIYMSVEKNVRIACRHLHYTRLFPSGIYGAVYGLTLFLASCMRSFRCPFFCCSISTIRLVRKIWYMCEACEWHIFAEYFLLVPCKRHFTYKNICGLMHVWFKFVNSSSVTFESGTFRFYRTENHMAGWLALYIYAYKRLPRKWFVYYVICFECELCAG